MPEFLDAAHDLMSGNHDIAKDDFRLVFELVQERLLQLQARSAVDLDNVESVFSLIEMGRLLGKLPRTSPEEVERAGQAIRTVLAETIELNCQFKISEQGDWLPHHDYEQLLTGIQNRAGDCAFLTFNYDVALDHAFVAAGLPVDYALSENPSAGVPLLKLHGSLNWLGCTGCGAVRALDLRQFISRPPRASWRPRPGTRQAMRVSRALQHLGHHCEKDTGKAEPALVPPSWNKTQYHGQFARVWKRAAIELSQAEVIAVIGYSFPQSDAFFRDLLAIGLTGSARLRRFQVINPDKEAGERFRRLLGPALQSRFEWIGATFDGFLGSGRGQETLSGKH